MGTMRHGRAFTPARLLALLILLVFPVLGCSDGDECDTCTSDDDCQSGLVCSDYSDGSRRCGSGQGSSTCKVR